MSAPTNTFRSAAHRTISLAKGKVLSIHEAQRLLCLSGELWLTGPDTDDHILRPGDERPIAGHTVVEALDAAELVLILDPPATHAVPWAALAILSR